MAAGLRPVPLGSLQLSSTRQLDFGKIGREKGWEREERTKIKEWEGYRKREGKEKGRAAKGEGEGWPSRLVVWIRL